MRPSGPDAPGQNAGLGQIRPHGSRDRSTARDRTRMAEARSLEERAERWPQWMAAAQRGETEEYQRLLTELLPFVRAVVRGRLRDDPAVDDITQEVLLRIHTARHTYRTERPLMPWVRTIARNAVIDHARKRERWLARLSHVHPDIIPAEAPEHVVHRIAPVLERALKRLPTGQREAVVLLKLEGLSVAEAATRVGISTNALKLRAHRGYRAMRNLLGRELL